LNRRNFLIMLLCLEVMLLAANLVFLTASVALDDVTGQLLALWVMTAAAAETALGLALCVLHYRLRATLDVELISLMKGSNKRICRFCLFVPQGLQSTPSKMVLVETQKAYNFSL